MANLHLNDKSNLARCNANRRACRFGGPVARTVGRDRGRGAFGGDESLPLVSLGDNPQSVESVRQVFDMRSAEDAVVSARVDNIGSYKDVVDEESLNKLSASSSFNTLVAVACFDDCPQYILRRLSNHPAAGVREVVARSENTPKGVLSKLASDDDIDVREQVSMNENTPAGAMRLLSKDRSVDIKMNVAMNKRTPADVLVDMSKSKNKKVKAVALGNPKTPIKDAIRLAEDKDMTFVNGGVFKGDMSYYSEYSMDTLVERDKKNEYMMEGMIRVAKSSEASPALLGKLVNEGRNAYYGEVAAAAITNPNVPKDVFDRVVSGDNRYDRAARIALGEDVKTSQHILSKLSKTDARYFVASNPNIPPNVVEDIILNGSDKEKMNLCGNPNTPESALSYLCDNDRDNVFAMINVINHRNVNDDMLVKLSKEYSDAIIGKKKISTKVADTLILNDNRGISSALLLRKDVVVSSNVISNYADTCIKDGDTILLSDIAKNKQTSKETLGKIVDAGYCAGVAESPHLDDNLALKLWSQASTNNRSDVFSMNEMVESVNNNKNISDWVKDMVRL